VKQEGTVFKEWVSKRGGFLKLSHFDLFRYYEEMISYIDLQSRELRLLKARKPVQACTTGQK
jgi:hypothetical protein